MANFKTYFVIILAATCISLVPVSSDVHYIKPQGLVLKESFLFNVTSKNPVTITDKGLIMSYIYRPVELTVKTVSAVTLIPQQRVACLTLAVTSHRFLLPQELTVKEHVITTAFWVLIDSLETPTVVEYTDEVKEFGDMVGRIAVLPIKTFGRIASASVRVLGDVISHVSDRFSFSRVMRMASDVMLQFFNDVIDIARPLFAQDDLLYITTGNETARFFYSNMSRSTSNVLHKGTNSINTALASLMSALHNNIYRPVQLTVKTVSAVTLIPQQRVACLTLAVTSHGFLLPQELTVKEHVITTAFWVLIDSLETPTVVEYTGEVKVFGDMIGRIAVLPFRMLGGMASLLVQCSCNLVKWSCNITCDCLNEVIDLIAYIHGCCWPVLVDFSNYWVLPLFVQENHVRGLALYIIHGMSTILHVLYFMVKLVILDPISTVVYYSWSDTTWNYIIQNALTIAVDSPWFVLVKHWKLTSVGVLACLWLYSLTCRTIDIITGQDKKQRKLRVLRKRRY